ncbi:MAG: hypothetical protein UU54_C0009G0005 [Candidatus Yanofskybacteria bacterium GW2011_GWA2_41_22]|uniref:PPM-type phosphatase domain-containing protein n=4 Tax=Candidatus Yanofskyibacteriota TaxID=1752733 RepID=A0A1F8HNU9_9BACT|nr:MAG: hypothetical protein UU54_C0009G0005 [Candidatus Yanofskybacteria bacterium GW2011_GWA2_41_22]KKS25484.1 MAG: hypothetical protein UU84_C0042G0002 [Candidatus Yanofskybacteria bacterium GW2011_GWC2_41_9]OGN00167.1 MAG: hypothetical protein A2736_01290 [Candidatus Yanofskybacteria bacterium RIFCSPHIGHO2_01_FULL_41_27]OGN10057.1 MAG: hypothetical protein A3C64_00305 [Candidatus Yanofskybacteria bacterium RIFCSPHIGHO2_02_FULL_41_12]OGN20827.1 MAG: hypothetical protein A3B00_02005 [Candidat
MEKIFLKSEAKEILIKNNSETQRSDVFSYDYGQDDAKRTLGNLFVVGNVQNGRSGAESAPDGSGSNSADISYIINLVASLAKREYYAKQELTPKEAFSSTLKKINGVIEEFFKNKDLKINIGIFAIAGENINISKLGKFKILMARDGKTIDILNNIDLFSKEVVQEKEFSHVISGKIAADDKILAYYPDHSLVAREKTVKSLLLKENCNDFIDEMKAIKEKKDSFCCAAFYINLNKTKEPAHFPQIQPEESPPQKSVMNLLNKPESPAAQSPKDFPRIIPAEFALGKKANPLTAVYNKMRPFLPKPRNKIALFAVILGIVVVFSFTVKIIFIQSPGDKTANGAVNEAKASLKLAKAKISQNDPASARELLMAAITSLNTADASKTAETKEQILQEFDGLDAAVPASLTLKDTLPDDKIKELALITSETDKIKSGKYNLPSEMINFNLYEGNLYILLADAIFKISDAGKTDNAQANSWLKSEVKLPPDLRLIAIDGNIYILNKSGALFVYFRGDKIGEFNTFVLPEEKSKLLTTKDSKTLYLINQTLGRIYLINKATGALEKTLVIGSSEPIENAFLGEGEIIYIISKDNKIWEVR